MVKRLLFILILTGLFCVNEFPQNNPAEIAEPPPLPPPPVSNEFVSDGCTWFPDGNYYDCCFAHDREYFTGGSWKERWRSDKKLFHCVAAKPKFYNKIISPIMWLGVRTFGGAWLNTKASWGFGKKKKSPERILPEKKPQS
jgi:hypothetical protein